MTPANKPGYPASMSCAEFQEQLPEFFASQNNEIPEGSPLHDHLRTCENCSALVNDLHYIAEQARLLLQTEEEEPSDAVWRKIQEGIDFERAQEEEALNGDPK